MVEVENLMVAFFIGVTVLSLISITPSESFTGQLIMPSATELDLGIAVIFFSLFIVFYILLHRKILYRYPI